MSDLVLPPILYWSPSRAAHPDSCESAPGVLIDTASTHGLVLATKDDSWQVLDRLPDDAIRLVAEPPARIALSGASTVDRAYSDGYRTGFMHGGGGRMAGPIAKDGDADELLLVRDDERMSGRTTIGHSRLPAAVIATRLLASAPHDAIRESYPDVTDEQLRVLAGLLADYRLVAKVADVEAIASWCDGIGRKAEAQGWRDLAVTAPVIARELRRAAVGEPLLNTGHGLDDAARDVVEYLAAAGKLRGSEPTAAEPWTATVSWTPQQNAGAVSLLDGRTPLFAILGSLAAGEIPEVVAADYGAQVESVRVLDVLRRELAQRETDARTERLRDRVAELESRLQVHAERELDELRPAQPDDATTPGPPEPRYRACGMCRIPVDRTNPHVAQILQLEVLTDRDVIDVRDSRPGPVWHPGCAPTTWTGGR